MEGTWEVTQTLKAVKTPLDLACIGGPMGLTEIVEKSLAESVTQINVPVTLRL
jgi:hypothetical protein